MGTVSLGPYLFVPLLQRDRLLFVLFIQSTGFLATSDVLWKAASDESDNPFPLPSLVYLAKFLLKASFSSRRVAASACDCLACSWSCSSAAAAAATETKEATHVRDFASTLPLRLHPSTQ